MILDRLLSSVLGFLSYTHHTELNTIDDARWPAAAAAQHAQATAQPRLGSAASGAGAGPSRLVLSVFGHPPAEGAVELGDIPYINWLLMARAGLAGLEFYSPSTSSWRQAGHDLPSASRPGRLRV